MKQVVRVSVLLTIVRALEAQVETATIRTSGISCGVCAVVSEINFRRLPGVASVRISLSDESVILSYKSDASLNIVKIREILEPLDVRIVQLHIKAQGRVQEERGKRYFIAGRNRFVLLPADTVATIPVDAPVSIEGTVDGRSDPVALKVLSRAR